MKNSITLKENRSEVLVQLEEIKDLAITEERLMTKTRQWMSY